jgi:hypothetical protein
MLRAAQADLERWRDSLHGRPNARKSISKAILNACFDELRRTKGLIPAAVSLFNVHPKTYRWRFHGDWWMIYVIRDHRRWVIFPDRTVTIIRILRSSSPPDPPTFLP